MQLAIKKGYRILVISGGKSAAVKTRLNLLGISDVHIGVEDKLQVLKNYISQNSLSQEQVLFMGDDLPDFEAMQFAGLACCPAAVSYTHLRAHETVLDIVCRLLLDKKKDTNNYNN